MKRDNRAGQAMGFCVCGSHVEAGESIVMVQGKAVHVNCQKKAAEQTADPQMDLWQNTFLFSGDQHAALEYAEQVTGAPHVAFDGETVLAIDIPRLAGQIAKVYELMRDGQYRTLSEIACSCGCLETSAGARLRDLRKVRFGSHEVVSRRVPATALLYEYRLILSDGPAATTARTNDQRQAA